MDGYFYSSGVKDKIRVKDKKEEFSKCIKIHNKIISF